MQSIEHVVKVLMEIYWASIYSQIKLFLSLFLLHAAHFLSVLCFRKYLLYLSWTANHNWYNISLAADVVFCNMLTNWSYFCNVSGKLPFTFFPFGHAVSTTQLSSQDCAQSYISSCCLCFSQFELKISIKFRNFIVNYTSSSKFLFITSHAVYVNPITWDQLQH